jgi:hypothetical protein
MRIRPETAGKWGINSHLNAAEGRLVIRTTTGFVLNEAEDVEGLPRPIRKEAVHRFLFVIKKLEGDGQFGQ